MRFFMNELLEFSVSLLIGFMIGFSFHGWLKDIQSNRKKESRLVIPADPKQPCPYFRPEYFCSLEAGMKPEKSGR
jgi:hypothetical protein